MKKLYVVGIGLGEYDMMTGRAIAALQSADVIVRLSGIYGAGQRIFPRQRGNHVTTPMRPGSRSDAVWL